MKPIRIKKPIQNIAKPATQPWDRYQFIQDPEERRLTWEKFCEKQEIEAHLAREAEFTELYHACRANHDVYAWRVLEKLGELRQHAMKRGWVRMPWEEAVQA